MKVVLPRRHSRLKEGVETEAASSDSGEERKTPGVETERSTCTTFCVQLMTQDEQDTPLTNFLDEIGFPQRVFLERLSNMVQC